MMYALAAIALVIVAILIAKFRGLLYKTKDAALVKEDQTLKNTQTKLEAEVVDLKTKKVVTTALTPEQVEDYWNKKK